METITIKAWQDDEICVVPQDSEKEIRIVFVNGEPAFTAFTWLTLEQARQLANALLAAAREAKDSHKLPHTGLHDDNGYDPETAGIE